MTQRTIQIRETYYDEKRDLVQWLVRDISSGKKLVLCWPGQDLGPAVGVNAQLTPELIKQFNKDIEGKTINLVAEADVKEMDVDKFKTASDDEIEKSHAVFDKYPYQEVLESLQEQGQFQDAGTESKDEKSGYFSPADLAKEDEKSKD